MEDYNKVKEDVAAHYKRFKSEAYQTSPLFYTLSSRMLTGAFFGLIASRVLLRSRCGLYYGAGFGLGASSSHL